ncbi:hypothetical protein BDN72DRAFT_343396 [Pluteus cervinus]|uniref:Uncharacterized protein n=1 Tax=Pluteus cervinus TaxID=181527 RepID=A0ACD3B3B1_9AGAR|nr:hypothetical protein BDN72DRAFT_343396 [Pluteus cervinus]
MLAKHAIFGATIAILSSGGKYMYSSPSLVHRFTHLTTAAASVLHPLLARQSDPLGSIPASCTNDCTTISNALTVCTTTACLCTAANGNSLESCVDCIVNLLPTSAQITQGQAIIDQFNTGCVGTGLTSLTLQVASTAAPAASTAVAGGGATFISTPPAPVAVTSFSQNIPAATGGANGLPNTGTNQGGGNTGGSGGSDNPFAKSAASSNVGSGLVVTAVCAAYFVTLF